MAQLKESNEDSSEVLTEPGQFPDLKCGLAYFCLRGIIDIITHIQAHKASATTLQALPKHTTPSIRRWASQHACLKQWAGLALLADREEYKDRLFDTYLDSHATPVQRGRVREGVVGVLEGLVKVSSAMSANLVLLCYGC